MVCVYVCVITSHHQKILHSRMRRPRDICCSAGLSSKRHSFHTSAGRVHCVTFLANWAKSVPIYAQGDNAHSLPSWQCQYCCEDKLSVQGLPEGFWWCCLLLCRVVPEGALSSKRNTAIPLQNSQPLAEHLGISSQTAWPGGRVALH